MGAKDGLTAYRGKRHFDRTREPPGARRRPRTPRPSSSRSTTSAPCRSLSFGQALEDDHVLKRVAADEGPGQPG